MQAYLKVKYLGIGRFSSERLIEVKSSTGEVYEGIFQDCHMKGESLVKVNGVNGPEDSCLVRAMSGEGCGFYGHGVDGYDYLTVKKEQVLFEEQN